MTDKIAQKILGACFRFLVPIARILLANGIGYRDFDQITRQAFVQVARSEYGLRGRDTNLSRISAMTGIPRKKIRAMKTTGSPDSYEPTNLLSPLADLLHSWATSPEYKNSRGQTRNLSLLGDDPFYFGKLVQNCMGDVPVGAVKSELTRMGAIAEDGNEIRLLRRSLIPTNVAERLESALVYSLRGLANTIAHNTDPSTPENERFFERFVESRELNIDEVGEMRQKAHAHLKDISESLDLMLNPKRNTSPVETAKKRVGIGLYYCE